MQEKLRYLYNNLWPTYLRGLSFKNLTNISTIEEFTILCRDIERMERLCKENAMIGVNKRMHQLNAMNQNNNSNVNDMSNYSSQFNQTSSNIPQNFHQYRNSKFSNNSDSFNKLHNSKPFRNSKFSNNITQSIAQSKPINQNMNHSEYRDSKSFHNQNYRNSSNTSKVVQSEQTNKNNLEIFKCVNCFDKS